MKQLLTPRTATYSIGDVYIRKDANGDFYVIQKITDDSPLRYHLHRKYSDEPDAISEHCYTTETAADLEKNYVLLNGTIAEARAFAERALQGEFLEKQQEFDVTDSSLMSTHSKEALEMLASTLEEKSSKLAMIQMFMKNEVETRKNQMQQMVWAMQDQYRAMLGNITKLQRVIQSLSLYLGLDEEIVQFQVGVPAAEEELITFRQLTLYIDEEVGDASDGGMDINNLEDFENWLKVPENLKQVFPEPKGMVAFKPRRKPKDYGDKWDNALMAPRNNTTFFLIRNGGNLYYIYSPNISVGRFMFPSEKEMQELWNTMQSSRWESDREKAIEEVQNNMKLALLFQGLIDRTDVFNPHPVVNLFKGGEGVVKFLYDGDGGLDDGRKPFRQFQKEVNETLERGDRIVVVPGLPSYKHDHDRYLRFYAYDRSAPYPPTEGIFNLDLKKDRYKKNDVLTILAPVTNSWRDTNRNFSYVIEKDDTEILAYDKVSLEEAEYYLTNRRDRHNYLDMIPVLKKLVAELKHETYLEQMCAATFAFKLKVPIEEVQESIQWWKHKVIRKRPLAADEAKAWRMISKRLKSKK